MDESVTQALQTADALKLFEALPPSHRKEYLQWINEAKKTETKDKRIAKMIAMLKRQ